MRPPLLRGRHAVSIDRTMCLLSPLRLPEVFVPGVIVGGGRSWTRCERLGPDRAAEASPAPRSCLVHGHSGVLSRVHAILAWTTASSVEVPQGGVGWTC